ncbi:hypothetical protein HIJ94_22620, partial [Cronobacter sakazakii]|nr:hypothetical protein [Cronobacter sakazakii]
MTAGRGRTAAQVRPAFGLPAPPRQYVARDRSRRPVLRWGVARTLPHCVTAGRGRTAAQVRPAFGLPAPPRQHLARDRSCRPVLRWGV